MRIRTVNGASNPIHVAWHIHLHGYLLIESHCIQMAITEASAWAKLKDHLCLEIAEFNCSKQNRLKSVCSTICFQDCWLFKGYLNKPILWLWTDLYHDCDYEEGSKLCETAELRNFDKELPISVKFCPLASDRERMHTWEAPPLWSWWDSWWSWYCIRWWPSCLPPVGYPMCAISLWYIDSFP